MEITQENVECNLPVGYTACVSPHIPEHSGLIYIYTSNGLNNVLLREVPENPVAIIHVERRELEVIDVRKYMALISDSDLAEIFELQKYKGD